MYQSVCPHLCFLSLSSPNFFLLVPSLVWIVGAIVGLAPNAKPLLIFFSQFYYLVVLSLSSSKFFIFLQKLECCYKQFFFSPIMQIISLANIVNFIRVVNLIKEYVLVLFPCSNKSSYLHLQILVWIRQQVNVISFGHDEFLQVECIPFHEHMYYEVMSQLTNTSNKNNEVNVDGSKP